MRKGLTGASSKARLRLRAGEFVSTQRRLVSNEHQGPGERGWAWGQAVWVRRPEKSPEQQSSIPSSSLFSFLGLCMTSVSRKHLAAHSIEAGGEATCTGRDCYHVTGCLA